MMNYFITFGSKENYKEAANRLCVQADRTKLFDESISYYQEDLVEDSCWKIHEPFYSLYSKRYGLGLWKPLLIKNQLQRMKDGDILFYADAGCEFDLDCENIQEEYAKLCEQLNTVKILSTISTSLNPDIRYNEDILVFMEMMDDDIVYNLPLEAKSLLIENNIDTRNIVEKWYDLCVEYYKRVENKTISIDESVHYEESIWSLLIKKKGLYNMLMYEFSLNRIICVSKNISGVFRNGCRVTSSPLYSQYFGDEFIESNQIVQMSKLIRKLKPQYVFETGFGYGRTMVTMLESCCNHRLLHYVNCDKNYSLYTPISNMVKDTISKTYSNIKWYEKRTPEFFQEGILQKEFPNGIDWATIDGSPTYEGCLCELFSVLPHMKKGGIIYVVTDRLKLKNRNIANASDFFESYNKDKFCINIDMIMGREIKWIEIK
jgi:hypothetical protein